MRNHTTPASAYVADFCLLASDIPWDDQALMEQFRFGLRNDVKDLPLTFLEEPKSLIEAISRACDAITASSNDVRNVSSKCQGQDHSLPMLQS